MAILLSTLIDRRTAISYRYLFLDMFIAFAGSCTCHFKECPACIIHAELCDWISDIRSERSPLTLMEINARILQGSVLQLVADAYY